MAINWAKKINPRWQALKNRLINDPHYRFRSFEEIAIAVELGIKIDVNTADVDDWLRLPGISIRQARSLVELSRNGLQFLSIEDIAAALGISTQRLKPIERILEFCYYDPESLLKPAKINPNTASLAELEQIPFINPDLAKLIQQNHQVQGNYRNLADFQRRLSLDSQFIAQLMYYLQFD